jgi:hypothetical protein
VLSGFCIIHRWWRILALFLCRLLITERDTSHLAALRALGRALEENHQDMFSDKDVEDVVSMCKSMLLDLANSSSWNETGSYRDAFDQELGSVIVN